MAPVALLRDLHVVDTPGTNAINRAHERLTKDFVPRADLVLFVTSADRPFTETERVFLESIRDWGKKIVLVVNKIDIFQKQTDLAEVLQFVRDSSNRLLGFVPDLFPVSARLAAAAKHGNSGESAHSHFEILESFIQHTLDDGSRFRLKLANPIGVGEALARRYEAVARERHDLLATDIAALADIERQLSLYRDDLVKGFELHMSAIEKVLLEMEGREHQYLEDTLRVARVFDLLNRRVCSRNSKNAWWPMRPPVSTGCLRTDRLAGRIRIFANGRPCRRSWRHGATSMVNAFLATIPPASISIEHICSIQSDARRSESWTPTTARRGERDRRWRACSGRGNGGHRRKCRRAWCGGCGVPAALPRHHRDPCGRSSPRSACL